MFGLLFLTALVLAACAGAPAAGPAEPAQGSSTLTEPENTAGSDDTADLQQNITTAVDQYRNDVVNNATRMLFHTLWVLMDEDNIKDELARQGYQLVGEVILGAGHESAGFDIWGVESPPMSGGQAYVATNEKNLVVAFRSTASDDGWEVTLNVLTDLKAYPKKLSFIDDSVPNAKSYQQLKVHSGFHNEYLRYRDRILLYVSQHPDKDIYLTGHSLGGALAVLSSFDIAAHTQRPVTVFTFGQPRVGGPKFREAYDALVPNSYRVVVDGDPIARVPGLFLDYEHVGNLLQIDPEGSQLPLQDISATPYFQAFDFPKHLQRVYYRALKELHARCAGKDSQTIASCLDIGSLAGAAGAERRSAKTAWESVPKDTIPWEGLAVNEIPIEKIPVDSLPTEFPAIELPSWGRMIPVDNIIIDNVPIDQIPLDKIPVDKLPVGIKSLDKLSQKVPKAPFKKK